MVDHGLNKEAGSVSRRGKEILIEVSCFTKSGHIQVDIFWCILYFSCRNRTSNQSILDHLKNMYVPWTHHAVSISFCTGQKVRAVCTLLVDISILNPYRTPEIEN